MYRDEGEVGAGEEEATSGGEVEFGGVGATGRGAKESICPSIYSNCIRASRICSFASLYSRVRRSCRTSSIVG